jgi:hypothetical protein
MTAEDQKRGPPAPKRAGGGSPTTTTTLRPDPDQGAGDPDRIANRYRPKRPRFCVACLDRLCINCSCARSSAGERGQA